MKKNLIYTTVAVAIIVALTVFLFQNQIRASLGGDNLQLALVVNYSDGTSETFKQPALSLVPITITDTSGKTVSSIRLECYATVDYTGNAVSWSFVGQTKWQLQEGTTIVRTYTHDLSASGSNAPPNKQAFVVSSSTLAASDLEGLYSGWTSGMTYLIKFSCEQGAKFTINYADGTSLYRNLDTTATGTWQFKYVSSKTFTAMSVTWQINPYY